MQVNAPVYTELSTILSHKSASLHFRKTEIRLLSVPKDKLEYNSDLLYPDDSPCRITFAFVDEKAREGSYSKNPFEFRRSWEVIEQLNEQPVSREELLEKELQILREKLQNLERKVDGEPERRDPERRDSILGRLRSSFAVNQEEDQESEASEESRNPPPYERRIGDAKKKTIYIKKVELTLNNVAIGVNIE